MKLAELDWQAVLAALPEWEALSPAARAAFVQVVPSTGVAASKLGGAVAELREAGLVQEAGARGTLLGATPRFRWLLEALRAMERFPVLEAGAVPGQYLRENFTKAELERLSRALGQRWVDPGIVSQLTSSVDWVEGFLALQDPGAVRKWEAARLAAGERPHLAGAEMAPALQALLRGLAAHPRGVPLRDLGTLLPALDGKKLGAVLRAGIRYLFLFPALREEEPEAAIGLVPRVAWRLGPPPPPPEPVDAAESFEAPYRIGDMTTVLVEATVEPVPVRGGDGGLYVRAQKLLAQRLPPLPEWVVGALDEEWDDEDDEEDAGATGIDPAIASRLSFALYQLQSAGLAKTARGRDGKFHFAATAKGKRWVALPEGERLRERLDVYRASGQRNPHGWYAATSGDDFFPMRLSFDLPKGKVDLRAALTAAFLSIPEGKMVPLREFLAFHGRLANPLLALGIGELKGRFGYSALRLGTREEWEEVWAGILVTFLAVRLVPFGAARLGRTAGGATCVGLAAPGRYLLGAADSFEYQAPPAGEILVQPDFEIVFLAPAPAAEPELARFAERIGSGVGALFRLTRASVMRGAHQGLSAEAMVATLTELSRSGVPANVARQIRDWAGAARHVSITTAVLVECPDAETAARVLALTGGKGSQLTPTLIRLPPQALDRTAFTRKLRERGIFIAP
jgi:hypothetical protein